MGPYSDCRVLLYLSRPVYLCKAVVVHVLLWDHDGPHRLDVESPREVGVLLTQRFWMAPRRWETTTPRGTAIGGDSFMALGPRVGQEIQVVPKGGNRNPEDWMEEVLLGVSGGHHW